MATEYPVIVEDYVTIFGPKTTLPFLDYSLVIFNLALLTQNR